jgi:hypothetical protein
LFDSDETNVAAVTQVRRIGKIAVEARSSRKNFFQPNVRPILQSLAHTAMQL